MRRSYRILALASLALALCAGAAIADPCLVVYPTGSSIYHYDSNEYLTVGPGDPLYDPAYDRGGEVLIDRNSNTIALNIYQAPGLAGFQLDNTNQGYFFEGSTFDLVVDGFNNSPTIFVNIVLVMEQLPSSCPPNVLINGSPALFDPTLGFYQPLGDLSVSTPAQGNNVSDTMTFNVSWSNCAEVQFWAFSDENFNLKRDGGECFVAFSHDTTVPTASSSWSAVKTRFRAF